MLYGFPIRVVKLGRTQKRPEAMAPGLYVKLGNDYGSLCGDVVSELNEQLTCGFAPTVDVV